MRLKLISMMVISFALILTCVAFISYHYYAKDLHTNMENFLIEYTDEILMDINDNPKRFKKDPLLFIRSRVTNRILAGTIILEFIDPQGKLIASSNSPFNLKLPFTENGNEIFKDFSFPDKSKLKTYQQNITINNKLYGYVIVAASANSLYRSLYAFRLVLLLLIVFVFVLLILGISTLYHYEFTIKQKRFLSFVSHELRNPLAIILGQTEMALRHEKNIKLNKSVLLNIRDEAQKMKRLINNFLSFLRNESGTEKFQRDLLNISEICLEELEQFIQRYPSKKFSIQLPQEIYVKGDEQKLRIAINNILENAAKYTKSKGRISCRLYQANNMVRIDFKDNGIGMNKKHIPYIFDPYYRVDAQKTGLGIGLALVKTIILNHKGKIKVKSSPGKGTVFSILLPRKII
jgi:signal transduction histidine kinase